MLALSAALVPPTPAYSEIATQADSPPPANLRPDLIPQIHCGDVLGSAWAVGPHVIATAYHVTSKATVSCTLPTTGETAYIIAEDKTADFALLYVEQPRSYSFKVDCSGYQTGETYYGAGWPEGGFTVVPVTATKYRLNNGGYWWGERILEGSQHFLHGQSGGPVVNRLGYAVGMVNGLVDNSRQSLSRDLSDTWLCRNSSN